MKLNFRLRFANLENHFRLWQITRQIAAHAQPAPDQQPIVVFNTSSRISGISQNTAFTILSSWGLRLAGVPVKHFVCHSGMSHCILGTSREDYKKAPPCQACIRQSKRLYHNADAYWFKYKIDPVLDSLLLGLSVEELSNFEYQSPNPASPLSSITQPIPLGKLVLPSIRWALRQHRLPDDDNTRYLLRQYILSAYNIAQEFAAFIEQTRPASALIFNGILYPEGTARWVAQQKGLRVITQEVSFQRFSAFFTTGEATAYPINIPEDFKLSEKQNRRLDEYLEKRFQGKFTMAGIQFWPEMRGLDENLLEKGSQYEQLVPVFTNVVYDTSQVHANQVFPHMFAWLDMVLQLIHEHPETLFVIRAHPDEMRPGTAKLSRESVRDWVKNNKVDQLPNVVFIDSQEYTSSYELIQRSKFVIVYNSSIGMEAALLGKVVLCGGKARYTQYPIVYFPETQTAYYNKAKEFIKSEEIKLPPEFIDNARRFLHYQLYRASLSFEAYLTEGHRKGYVQLRPFQWNQLLEENSETISVLVNGLARDQNTNAFLLEES